MSSINNNDDFHAYRTVAPSLFGATVRTALQNLISQTLSADFRSGSLIVIKDANSL